MTGLLLEVEVGEEVGEVEKQGSLAVRRGSRESRRNLPGWVPAEEGLMP